MITVTQQLDGGWWEGTLGDNTAWFPSNYVTIVEEHGAFEIIAIKNSFNLSEKVLRVRSKSPGVRNEFVTAPKAQYRDSIIKALIESEALHHQELTRTLTDTLQPLQQSNMFVFRIPC